MVKKHKPVDSEKKISKTLTLCICVVLSLRYKNAKGLNKYELFINILCKLIHNHTCIIIWSSDCLKHSVVIKNVQGDSGCDHVPSGIFHIKVKLSGRFIDIL